VAFGAIDRDDIFFFASDQVQGGGGGGFAEEEEEGDSDGVGESEVSIARVTSHDDVPLGHVVLYHNLRYQLGLNPLYHKSTCGCLPSWDLLGQIKEGRE